MFANIQWRLPGWGGKNEFVLGMEQRVGYNLNFHAGTVYNAQIDYRSGDFFRKACFPEFSIGGFITIKLECALAIELKGTLSMMGSLDVTSSLNLQKMIGGGFSDESGTWKYVDLNVQQATFNPPVLENKVTSGNLNFATSLVAKV